MRENDGPIHRNNIPRLDLESLKKREREQTGQAWTGVPKPKVAEPPNPSAEPLYKYLSIRGGPEVEVTIVPEAEKGHRRKNSVARFASAVSGAVGSATRGISKSLNRPAYRAISQLTTPKGWNEGILDGLDGIECWVSTGGGFSVIPPWVPPGLWIKPTGSKKRRRAFVIFKPRMVDIKTDDPNDFLCPLQERRVTSIQFVIAQEEGPWIPTVTSKAREYEFDTISRIHTIPETMAWKRSTDKLSKEARRHDYGDFVIEFINPLPKAPKKERMVHTWMSFDNLDLFRYAIYRLRPSLLVSPV